MSLTFGPIADIIHGPALSYDRDGYCLEPVYLDVFADLGDPAAPVTAPLDLAELAEFADPPATSPVGLRLVDGQGAA